MTKGARAIRDSRRGAAEGFESEEMAEMKIDKRWEPFDGTYYGIWNVEGEGAPVAMFPGRADAARELDRRRALPEDDDDHLDEYHQVFPCNLVGAWWNSYDKPKDGGRMVPEMTVAAYRGE
jgi:hypothetical protein